MMPMLTPLPLLVEWQHHFRAEWKFRLGRNMAHIYPSPTVGKVAWKSYWYWGECPGMRYCHRHRGRYRWDGDNTHFGVEWTFQSGRNDIHIYKFYSGRMCPKIIWILGWVPKYVLLTPMPLPLPMERRQHHFGVEWKFQLGRNDKYKSYSCKSCSKILSILG